MALTTVQDYIDAARFLLQDTVVTYRYGDADIVTALNLAVTELVRVRPDIYFVLLRTAAIPVYVTSALNDVVNVDVRHTMPVLYFMVGYTQLSDEEDVQDARAAALMTKFIAQVTTAGA
jgi:hypothetical protein